MMNQYWYTNINCLNSLCFNSWPFSFLPASISFKYYNSFSFYVSLGCLWLWQLFSLFLFLMALIVLGSASQKLRDCSLIWVVLMHGQGGRPQRQSALLITSFQGWPHVNLVPGVSVDHLSLGPPAVLYSSQENLYMSTQIILNYSAL